MIDLGPVSDGVEGALALAASFFYTKWYMKNYASLKEGCPDSGIAKNTFNKDALSDKFIPIDHVWENFSRSFPDTDFDFYEKTRFYRDALAKLSPREFQTLMIYFHTNEHILRLGEIPGKLSRQGIFEKTFSAKTPGEMLLLYEVMIDRYFDSNSSNNA